ncbi:hypothetical protein ACJX0J_030254, partial [Zea mays]
YDGALICLQGNMVSSMIYQSHLIAGHINVEVTFFFNTTGLEISFLKTSYLILLQELSTCKKRLFLINPIMFMRELTSFVQRIAEPKFEHTIIILLHKIVSRYEVLRFYIKTLTCLSIVFTELQASPFKMKGEKYIYRQQETCHITHLHIHLKIRTRR